jgi:hypothetical protein
MAEVVIVSPCGRAIRRSGRQDIAEVCDHGIDLRDASFGDGAERISRDGCGWFVAPEPVEKRGEKASGTRKRSWAGLIIAEPSTVVLVASSLALLFGAS